METNIKIKWNEVDTFFQKNWKPKFKWNGYWHSRHIDLAVDDQSRMCHLRCFAQHYFVVLIQKRCCNGSLPSDVWWWESKTPGRYLSHDGTYTVWMMWNYSNVSKWKIMILECSWYGISTPSGDLQVTGISSGASWAEMCPSWRPSTELLCSAIRRSFVGLTRKKPSPS